MFLDTVDDYLIDRVFQPMCDFCAETTGWSKRILMIIAFIVMAACCLSATIASCLAAYHVLWPFYIGTLVMSYGVFWTISRIKQLLDKDPGCDQYAETLDTTRLTEVHNRQRILTDSILVSPLLLWAYEYSESGIAIMFASTIAINLTNICIHYLRACTDLPRPPRTKVHKPSDGMHDLGNSPLENPTS